MSKKINILILEDNPLDVELSINILKESGYNFTHNVVQTRIAFLECLDTYDYNLILADYSLPTFDGMKALKLFIERDLDIPFIFVSGTLGEEHAIESMKAGATDYVLKNRLSRLGSVVKRALMETEERRQRKQADEKVKLALAEKTVLLQEIFHRTRNNMALIISLISLKSRNIKDKQVSNIFHDIINRIQSMSLVHQQLYKNNNLSEINIKDYIETLVTGLINSYAYPNDNITFDLDLEKNSIIIDSAIPCGLILNELITNSLKHAFPNGEEGNIKIKLKRIKKQIEIIYSDNGVGIPEKIDLKNNNSIGMKLITLLSKQLNAEMDLKTNNGVTCQFIFKDKSYKKRV